MDGQHRRGAVPLAPLQSLVDRKEHFAGVHRVQRDSLDRLELEHELAQGGTDPGEPPAVIPVNNAPVGRGSGTTAGQCHSHPLLQVRGALQGRDADQLIAAVQAGRNPGQGGTGADRQHDPPYCGGDFSQQPGDNHAAAHALRICAALRQHQAGREPGSQPVETGRLMAAPVLGPGNLDHLHSPGSGIAQHGGFGRRLVAPDNTHRGEALLPAHRRQRVQVIGPGTPERDQPGQTPPSGRGDTALQFEVLIARCETAGAVETQQCDVGHVHAGNQSVVEGG